MTPAQRETLQCLAIDLDVVLGEIDGDYCRESTWAVFLS